MANVPPADSGFLHALIASAVPVVLGAVTVHFKLFIEPQSDFRSRISLQRKILLEQIASKHATLLRSTRLIVDETLRGVVCGRGEPDLVGEFTCELFRVFTVFHRLDTLKLVVRCAYWFLLVTIIAGILGFLAACVFAQARNYVFLGGLVLIIAQVMIVVAILVVSNKLETYEDVT